MEDGKEVEVGKFVLVNFYLNSRKNRVYRYVCKVLEVNNVTSEVKVMGFKSSGKKCIFTAIDDNVSIVNLRHIINILPDPVLSPADDVGEVYTLEENVNVKEFC